MKGLPHEFLLFMEHLKSLSYEDEPDYDYLRNLLLQVYTREGYSPDTPFDWETDNTNCRIPPQIEISSFVDEKVRILFPFNKT